MLELLLKGALLLFSISIALFLYRVIKGPTVPDRVLAMDTLGINLLAAMAILSVLHKAYAFSEVILLFGILSFIGTVAFSKFIERGVLIDDDCEKRG
ncbi:MAG: Na(+)/H(+) antiporter subunit F1 [Clostridia bacterium]|nr:Na(+)/H(+) antiporter subunit F1 [Clostridia bacterium]